jgi:hypothetical protein
MTDKYKSHRNQVEAWLSEVVVDLTPEQLVQLFDLALTSLWNRARTTVSSVFLTAVWERVALSRSESRQLLALLQLSEDGLDFKDLHRVAPTIPENQLVETFKYAISEFIAILGDVTNEVLTPSLYEDLAELKTKGD